MSKSFPLILMSTLPALLAACGPSSSDVDLDGYSRKAFKSEAECRAAYKDVMAQGLQSPCARESRGSGGFIFWGPYIGRTSASSRYLGYGTGAQAGKVSSSGLEIGKNGVSNTYKAPSISRGGLSTASRASGSSSSYGG